MKGLNGALYRPVPWPDADPRASGRAGDHVVEQDDLVLQVQVLSDLARDFVVHGPARDDDRLRMRDDIVRRDDRHPAQVRSLVLGIRVHERRDRQPIESPVRQQVPCVSPDAPDEHGASGCRHVR